MNWFPAGDLFRAPSIPPFCLTAEYSEASVQNLLLTLSRSALALCLLIPSSMAADFEKDVKPILMKKCVSCHGPDEANGDVRLDTLSPDLLKNAAAAETWHDALNALNLGEMPPKDEPQLTGKERDILTGWISDEIRRVVVARRSTGGQVVIRRLNRLEYQNTMRDLLGLDLKFARNLPPDSPSEDGFTNNGQSLRMSALQLECYLEAAREALKRAIVTTEKPDVVDHSQHKSENDKNKGNYTSSLGRNGIFVVRSKEFPDEGEFLIRVRAKAVLPEGKPYPQLKAVLGYRADTETPSEKVGIIEVTSTEFADYEFRGRIEEFPRQSRTQSKYPGLLVWLTNAYSDGKPPGKPKQVQIEVVDKKGKKKKQKKTVWPVDPEFPRIEIESVRFKAPVFETWPPAYHQNILFPVESAKLDTDPYAEKVLERFMGRAFRRPATKLEITGMLAFFREVRAEVSSFEEAMRETLAMVLISPDFLYLVESSAGSRRKLNDHELASRMSYFLWSTMPDERLFELAHEGSLRDPKVLTAEVERLLADPRSTNFTRQFSDQWLDLSGVDRVAVNPNFYPRFKNELKPHMQQETRQFFAEVLNRNLSALAFLDSDFAMLNRPLAEHYGLSGPRGLAFERVDLKPEDGRGGLLTQASILLANSTGENSHPILRGVWIRDRLLNDPPNPPPPNVPALNSEKGDFAKLSLKEQLIAHRENEACARCHRGIDPWGIALEGFDAVGLKRESIKRKDGNKTLNIQVESEATLPGGHKVEGIADLKQYLLTEKREKFARAIVSRLLTYALGRSLELTDHEAVDELTAAFIQSDYRLKKLIELIAASEPFGSK